MKQDYPTEALYSVLIPDFGTRNTQMRRKNASLADMRVNWRRGIFRRNFIARLEFPKTEVENIWDARLRRPAGSLEAVR
jgi:hypothetical protein